VVAAVGQRAEWYRERHDPAKNSYVPPPALFHGHPYDLGRFLWTRHVWQQKQWLSEWDRKHWPYLLRRAKAVERTEEGTAVTLEFVDWSAILPHLV
jgi:hypothetical protein